MIEDLPQNVIHRLLSSRTTPVLPIVTENIDGETILSYARISLIRLDDGSVDVYFIPKWVDEDLEEFSIDQQEQLKAGRVVKADLRKEGRCFVQFDEVINQVMAVPVEIINQNISILTRTLFLSGDSIAWREDAKVDSLPRYNFGLFGCWVCGDDNTLNYISEDDYTEEILDEQKRTQSMNAAKAQLSQLKV